MEEMLEQQRRQQVWKIILSFHDPMRSKCIDF